MRLQPHRERRRDVHDATRAVGAGNRDDVGGLAGRSGRRARGEGVIVESVERVSPDRQPFDGRRDGRLADGRAEERRRSRPQPGAQIPRPERTVQAALAGDRHVVVAVAVQIPHRNGVRIRTADERAVGDAEVGRAVVDHDGVRAVAVVGGDQVRAVVPVEVGGGDRDGGDTGVVGRVDRGEAAVAVALHDADAVDLLVGGDDVHSVVVVEIAHHHAVREGAERNRDAPGDQEGRRARALQDRHRVAGVVDRHHVEVAVAVEITRGREVRRGADEQRVGQRKPARPVAGHDRHLALLRDLAERHDQVELSVLVEIGDRQAARTETGRQRGRRAEPARGGAQEDRNGVTRVVGDRQIQDVLVTGVLVVVEIADRHRQRSGAGRQRAVQREQTGSVAAEDLHGVRGVVDHDQVGLAVPVEVGRGDTLGGRTDREGLPHCREAAGAVAEQDHDRALRSVQHRDVHLPVAVPVPRGQARGRADDRRGDLRSETAGAVIQVHPHLLAGQVGDDQIGLAVGVDVRIGHPRGVRPRDDARHLAEGSVTETFHQRDVAVRCRLLVDRNEIQVAVVVEIGGQDTDGMVSHDVIPA